MVTVALKWGPTQVYSTGFGNTRALLHEGAQTHDQNAPLGTYVDHGLKRYRWCYFTGSIVKRGMLLKQTVALASGVVFSGDTGRVCFASAVYPYGGKGDLRVKLFSAASILSNPEKRFVGGTFDIRGGGGKGCSYGIKDYTLGRAGGTNVITLDSPLMESCTVSTQARLHYNPFYGLTVGSRTAAGGGGSAFCRGFATFSTTDSGFGWIQTKGLGVGIGSVVLTPGELLFNAELSGMVVPGQTAGIPSSGFEANYTPVARARSTNVAGKFVVLEIMIEK